VIGGTDPVKVGNHHRNGKHMANDADCHSSRHVPNVVIILIILLQVAIFDCKNRNSP
jgi:hypothetical protein